MDFGEAITEQVDAQHRVLIDESPDRIIGGRTLKVVLIGEDKYETYWCPKTYQEVFIDEK